MAYSKEDMARRAAAEIPAGSIVNLGIGLPTLCADYLPEGHAFLHSENGLLGMGPFPYEGEEDPQLINAGKQTVTVLPGGSTFDSAQSFAMIRGGHVDLAILGAMQVSARGDLANWAVPGGKIMGIGGAMDLASGCRRVIAVMQHATKDGEHKLVASCSYPLTARGVVDRVITELGVFDVTAEGLTLVELADGVSRSAPRPACVRACVMRSAASPSLLLTTRVRKPYWLRWASSAMTTTFRRSDSWGNLSPRSAGRNFWIVVKMTPPEATFSSSRRCSRSRACTGFWRSSSAQRAKVPKSCSSRSLRSVMTTSVGFSIAGSSMTRPA